MIKDLMYYENLHNNKYSEKLIKVTHIKNRYVYFETEFGLCKKFYYTFGIKSFDIRSALNKKEYFIKFSAKMHKNKYNYSITNYNNAKEKVSIICDVHGVFKQTPNKHLEGRGCEKCGRNSTTQYQQLNATGWSRLAWEKAGKKSKYFDSFKVYIIECWNETERFYKVGRTFNTMHRRFESKGHIPYFYKIIKIYEEDAISIYNLETKIKQLNKEYKYIPLLNFDGKQECFSHINY